MDQDWVHDTLFPYKIPFFGELDSVVLWKIDEIYTKAFSAAILLYLIDQKSRERFSRKNYESDMQRGAEMKDRRQTARIPFPDSTMFLRPGCMMALGHHETPCILFFSK